MCSFRCRPGTCRMLCEARGNATALGMFHYSLFTIHCSLFTVHYSLITFTIHSSLFTHHSSSMLRFLAPASAPASARHLIFKPRPISKLASLSHSLLYYSFAISPPPSTLSPLGMQPPASPDRRHRALCYHHRHLPVTTSTARAGDTVRPLATRTRNFQPGPGRRAGNCTRP